MGACVSSEDEFQDIESITSNYNYDDWISWKERLQTINSDELKQELSHTLGRKLINSIGPYGLQIIENFQFKETYHNEDFYILLRKLDIFFYLRLFPRNERGESFKQYTDRLLTSAANFGVKYPDIAVKESITFDLKRNGFLEQINGLVSIRNNIVDLKRLNMDEIIFLVTIFDSWEARARRDDFLKKLENKCFIRLYNENCCGRQHSQNGFCQARGQNCWKCDGLNHFAKVCKKNYIRDCICCGINHVENKCGAFGKQCSRCTGYNHFYWKCLPKMIAHCPNCGNSHVDIGRRCLAYGKTCSNCRRVGHLSVMCHNKRRR